MKFTLLLAAVISVVLGNAQIESIEYDPINHRFLATNGDEVLVIDGQGDIVGVFGTDPEANYGMEVMNEKLFAIMDSHVKAFELSDGTEVMDITIPGANFLNGMASDGDHRIWVTDFGAKKVHELDVTDLANPTSEIIVDNTVNTPNGITHDPANNRLVMVSWGSSAKIKAISLDDYAVTTLVTTSLSNIDGIDHDGEGNFYVSSWSPTRITRFSSEFTVDEIITAPGLSSPADICYAMEIDTLAIPNSGNQTVTFVGFGPVGIEDVEKGEFAFSVFPNPLTASSVVSFDLLTPSEVEINILNVSGQIVYQIMKESSPAASHKILLHGLELSKGSYIMDLKVGNRSWSKPVFVE